MNVLGIILGLGILAFIGYEVYGIIRDCLKRKQLKNNSKIVEGGEEK